MKKILIGLALTGLVNLSANAQAKYCSKFDQNFKVCRNQSGYMTCGNLPASCNGGSGVAQPTSNTQGYPYSNSTPNVRHSKYDINYPICMRNNGKYTVCTEDQAMNQEVTHAQPVNVDGSITPKKDCSCTQEHNGILVSYTDVTSCTAAMQMIEE